MIVRYLLITILIFSFFGCEDDKETLEPGQTLRTNNRVGASARELLSDDNFSTLVIEIDAMNGNRFSDAAMNDLVDFAEARLFKKVIVRTNDVSAQTKDYSTDEVKAFEDAHRNLFPTNDTITIYCLAVDGNFEQNGVLGIAYRNLSMAVFKQIIDDNTGGFGEPSTASLEATVLIHELAHLMGLVDNGTPMVNNHLDEGRGKHCNVESCLMYFATETSDVFSNVFSSGIPQLDAQCLEDLKANGGR